jgi:hypothetical protein
VAVAIAKKYQPKYISLGVESNSFYLFQQETFDLYVQYAREAYDEIKAVSPNTMVMNNFQLERMKGEASLTGQDFEQNWHIISMFEGKIDLVSFTIYPFLEFKAVDDIPNDYLAEIRDHTSLPIMITETGWPTKDIASGVDGSNQDQIDYMMKLIQQSNDIEVEVIVWVLPMRRSTSLKKMEERRESDRMSGFSFRMKNHIFRVVDFFFHPNVDMRIRNFVINEVMTVVDYVCDREAHSVNSDRPRIGHLPRCHGWVSVGLIRFR